MSSDYFDHLVGPLKRAAIDAYMKSHSSGFWQIEGDRYVIETSSADAYVTRPGENGEGGGDWESDNFIDDLLGVDRDGEFTSAFNEIRTTIDDQLAPWRLIPDPADAAALIESMRLANSTLSVGAVQSGGTVTGGGSIAGYINLILENSDAMAGGMITAFKAEFLAQLSKAISGQHAITTILGGHLAAQQKMWEGARATVVAAIESSTSAFRAAAGEGSIDWKTVIKVAGHVVAGVTLFAAAGAKTALGVADLGIKILDGAVPDNKDKTAQPEPDYDAVMAAFKRDLEDLKTKIEDEEKLVQDNITTNLGLIRADQGSYDLTRPPLLDVDDAGDLGRADEIRIDRLLVKEISDSYLPSIADELLQAKAHVGDTHDLSAFWRPGAIGVSSYGPSTEFHELRYLEWELLGNLGFEARAGGKTLSLAVDDIGQADTDSQDALEKHHSEIKDHGRPDGVYDPWN